MNHMGNDQIRKRVSIWNLSYCLQVRVAKENFEVVRRELRRVQEAKAKESVGAMKKDQYEIVRIESGFTGVGDGEHGWSRGESIARTEQNAERCQSSGSSLR